MSDRHRVGVTYTFAMFRGACYLPKAVDGTLRIFQLRFQIRVIILPMSDRCQIGVSRPSGMTILPLGQRPQQIEVPCDAFVLHVHGQQRLG